MTEERKRFIPLPMRADLATIQEGHTYGAEMAMTQPELFYKRGRNAEDVLITNGDYASLPNSVYGRSSTGGNSNSRSR